MRLKAQNAVPDIIIMRNLHLVKQDHIFQLCGISYYCAFSNNGVSTDKCAVSDLCLIIYDGRSANICCRRDRCRIRYPYIFLDLCILICGKRCSQLFIKSLIFGKSSHGYTAPSNKGAAIVSFRSYKFSMVYCNIFLLLFIFYSFLQPL